MIFVRIRNNQNQFSNTNFPQKLVFSDLMVERRKLIFFFIFVRLLLKKEKYGEIYRQKPYGKIFLLLIIFIN